MAKACSICVHPARQEIDARLSDKDTTMLQIIEWLAAEFSDEKIPSPQTLSRHKVEHLTKELARGDTRLLLIDGQLVDAQGRPLENVGIAAALRAIVTVGIANLLSSPERVSVKDVIEALRLMKSLGTVTEEMEEMLEMWASTFSSPKRKAKIQRGRQVIEAAVVETAAGDDAGEDADNPWGEFLGDDDANPEA